MEGAPDEEGGRAGDRPSGPGQSGSHPHQRPRNEPNLWILVGMTALALGLALAVLLLTIL